MSVHVAPLRAQQALIRLPQATSPAPKYCSTTSCSSDNNALPFADDTLRQRGFTPTHRLVPASAASGRSSARTWKIVVGALIGTAAGFFVADRVCRQQCIDDRSRSKLYIGYGTVGAIVGGFTGYIISAPKQ
jgi:hypothetical protein